MSVPNEFKRPRFPWGIHIHPEPVNILSMSTVMVFVQCLERISLYTIASGSVVYKFGVSIL